VTETLHFVVRTPAGSVLDTDVTSLRVPSDTGQVGLHPGAETAALVVEPGLALATERDRRRFVATGGGLLRCDGREVVLLTPLAVVGDSAAAVQGELEEALRTPRSDIELRAILQRLETGILQELRHSTSPSGPAGGLGAGGLG
jgi:F0F1-type ATP synthase epsilon subunit